MPESADLLFPALFFDLLQQVSSINERFNKKFRFKYTVWLKISVQTFFFVFWICVPQIVRRRLRLANFIKYIRLANNYSFLKIIKFKYFNIVL